jgi:flavin-dependent dehydrogenase
MMNRYDVAIIGGGPAGATLARLLAGRCRILLLHSGRKKCCGGILAPESQKMLAKLDLVIPHDFLVQPQPFAVAVLDLENRLVRRYARQYTNINRSAFDTWLLSLVPATVEIRNEAFYHWSQPNENGFEIFFTEKGENQSANVRYLIGADGAFSMVRREFFLNHFVPKRYISPQEWFEPDQIFQQETGEGLGVDFRNDYVGIFDSEITDFYAWMIPKNGKLILGAAIPYGENPKEKMERLKEKLVSCGFRFNFPFRREADQMLRPVNLSSICLGSERVLLIGEAAGLISPSSAEGISPALASAYFLAQSFGTKGFNLSAYRRAIWSLRWDFWLKKSKIPVMFCPYLRKLVMQSGLTALK